MGWQQVKTPNLGITYIGGWCLSAVDEAFGTPHLFGTATADWQSGENGHGNHDNDLPPRGVAVPVYFSLGSTDDGHIAIALPDGTVASSTLTGTHQGLYIHPSLHDLVTMYGQYNKGCTYLGWSEGVAYTEVVKWVDSPITSEQGGTDVSDIDDFRNCFLTQATRWPSDDEIKDWQKSGLTAYAWVQQNAPNVVRDQERVNAFKACWITVATVWPTDNDIAKWIKSGLTAYEYTQKNAPNPLLDDKENQIRDLNIALEKTEATGQAKLDLAAMQALRDAVKGGG